MEEYTRWASVPENLKTKTQLKGLGLRPVRGQEPVATFSSSYGDWKLYDITQAVARKPASPERVAQLAEARIKADRLRTCPGFGRHCGEYLSYEDYGWTKKRHNKPDGWQYVCRFCRDRKRASEWACGVLLDEGAIILDTETTGLDETAEIIEIAIINIQGKVLFESLVKPHGSMGASHIHGLTAEDVAQAPTWPEISQPLWELAHQAHRVIVYNAEYDRRLIGQTMRRWGLTSPAWEPLSAWFNDPAKTKPLVNWECAMEMYAEWVGNWSDRHHSYRWQPLEGGGHRALGDCLACLEYLRRMAKDE